MNILVTGSSGFIGGHLVKRLIEEGHFVVGVDMIDPEYTKPHRFHKCDLRNPVSTYDVFLSLKFNQVYNLACLMGGMGYIGNPEHNYDVMVGSSQIVINVLDSAIRTGVKKIFYSSSACVYNQLKQEQTDNPSLKESDAYPSFPDLVYGWQKLFSEQIHQAASDRIDIRIARFHNIYGPEGTYKGGREKAPAAICRKVASPSLVFNRIEDGERIFEPTIEVWGNGKQTRSFLYIDDCIDAVRLLMESDFKEPINIGSEEMISINDLAKMVIDISGRSITIKNIPGPTGVRGRNSDNTLIRQVLNWNPKYSLREGMEKTFHWINSKVNESSR